MNLDELYLDDDELELRYALKSAISDDRIISEAIKNYQLGRSQDVLYAEQSLIKGVTFATVNKIIKSNIDKRSSARREFNARLRKALIVQQGLPDLTHRYDAHHIVAKNSVYAKKAAQILKILGIDLDDAANGVFLPRNKQAKSNGAFKKAYTHTEIHTKAYYANVNYRVISAYEQGAEKEDIKRLLKDIADDLKMGVFPIHVYIPGAERF